MNNFREQYNFDRQNSLISKKGLSDEEVEKIKNQEFSADGPEFDHDNYRDNHPGQNVAIDVAERNLENPHYKSRLEHEAAQEAMEDFIAEATEVIPVLEEQLKYQKDKLNNLGKSKNAAKARLSVAKAYHQAAARSGNGNTDIENIDELLEASENLKKLAAEYEKMADLVDKIQGKLMYYKHAGLDIPEVDPNQN